MIKDYTPGQVRLSRSNSDRVRSAPCGSALPREGSTGLNAGCLPGGRWYVARGPSAKATTR